MKTPTPQTQNPNTTTNPTRGGVSPENHLPHNTKRDIILQKECQREETAEEKLPIKAEENSSWEEKLHKKTAKEKATARNADEHDSSIKQKLQRKTATEMATTHTTNECGSSSVEKLQPYDEDITLDRKLMEENVTNRPPYCRQCSTSGGVCQVDTNNQGNKLGYLQLQVGNLDIKALVDTGASVSVMSQETYDNIATCHPENILKQISVPDSAEITLADGKRVPILEKAEIRIKIFLEEICEVFLILRETHITILGWPFFANNDLTIDCKRRLLIRENCTFQINAVEYKEKGEKTAPRISLMLKTTQAITIPPGRQEYPYCKIEGEIETFKYTTGVVEPQQSHKSAKATTKYSIGHALTTLDGEGGCHVMLTNTDDEARTFPKDLEIAQFTIMNTKDFAEIKQIHPVAATYLMQAIPLIHVSQKEFQLIAHLAQEQETTDRPEIEDLAKEIQELTRKYNEPEPPEKMQENQDIVEYRPLEGATNEVWFATPENTDDPATLDKFNRRVYELILDCKDKEKLNPTESEEMRREFLDMFDWKETQFNKEQQKQIEQLLVKYHAIFARHRFDIGSNEEFKVKLTPAHNDPVYKKSPPTPVHIKEDLKVELALLQYYGILRTLPYSKYSSPIFAQRKPNGKMRLLVDLRRINHILRHDYDEFNFPIPSMDEANHHMANKVYFSKLDCSQAYHVIQMADERSVQLLAFNFESRTFAYQRLAQGLNRSATAFSSFMRKYLEKDIAADRCASFMDDVCTATKTFEQHVDALDHVFDSLKKSGLRLTVKKCEFGVPKIDYLGWTISKAGQGVQKEKITKQLAAMKMPRSVKQVQKMIGFMNYFKNYIPRLAEKLLPFYRMLQKGAKMDVTDEHRKMFKILKQDLKMTMERTMRLPLANKQYVIMSDASDFAAGFVLLIEDYTKEQSTNKKTYAPIAFGSQKFSTAQYKHTIHTKEFLAITLLLSILHICSGE